MANRREFLGYSVAAGLLAAIPASAAPKQRISPRMIPGTAEALPVIGLGNSTAFREADLTAATDLLDVFLRHGGGFVDAGGVSRLSVGTIAQSRQASEQLFIGNYVDSRAVDAMQAEAARVAEGQGKRALDLIHTRDLTAYRANHAAYRQMQENGAVRYIGVARSGLDGFAAIEQLIVDGLVDFIQVNYSLVEPQAAERLLPLAADHGIAVSINRPFINGRYFDLVSGMTLPAWAAEFDCASWAQFALKFVVSNPAVNCVLTETANPKHAIDNLTAGYGGLPDLATQRKMLSLAQTL